MIELKITGKDAAELGASLTDFMVALRAETGKSMENSLPVEATRTEAAPATVPAPATLPPTPAAVAPVVSAPVVPATVPPAPAPAAAAVAADTNAELDTLGAAWDKRIHTGTKSKNVDGTWRFKRGVSETLKQQVLAEQGVTPAPDTLPKAPAAVAPATLPEVPAAVAAVAPAPVIPATVPPAPVTPAVVPETVVPSFQLFMQKYSEATQKGKPPEETLARIVALGCAGGIPVIVQHPEVMATMITELDAWLQN